jgi:hypothetical protein
MLNPIINWFNYYQRVAQINEFRERILKIIHVLENQRQLIKEGYPDWYFLSDRIEFWQDQLELLPLIHYPDQSAQICHWILTNLAP